MSKKYRLSLMILSTIALIIVGRIVSGSFEFIVNQFWFASGFLLLILLSLIDQPFFSKDSNIFVNAVTAGISLLLIPQSERSVVFWAFSFVCLYLIISSYTLMWIRTKTLFEENTLTQVLSRINRIIGKPETIFSAFFLWGAIRQYSINSSQFNALLWFWIVFMVLNIPSIAIAIDSSFDLKKINSTNNVVGDIFGVQSKNTFLVKLLEERTETLKRFDLVEFLYSVDKKEHRGLVLDVYQLNQAQWIKVLTTPEIDRICGKSIDKYLPDKIYKSFVSSDNDYLKRFVGLICENSKIEKIRFTYNSKIEVYSGQLLELKINNHKVLYQIVEGITQTEKLEDAIELCNCFRSKQQTRTFHR